MFKIKSIDIQSKIIPPLKDTLIDNKLSSKGGNTFTHCYALV